MTTSENPDSSRNSDRPESASGSRRRRILRTAAILSAFIVLCIIAIVFLAPGLASMMARSMMSKAGMNNPKVHVDNVGPFFASASDVSFEGSESISVTGATGQAGYMPTSVMSGGPVETATVENAQVDINLDSLIRDAKSGEVQFFSLPSALPKLLNELPARSILVRGAIVSLKSNGKTRKMHVDALSRQSDDKGVSSTFSISGENGDQILVTADGSGDDGTISAEGSLDTMDWLIDGSTAFGVDISDKVGLEATPLVLQCIVKGQGGHTGKWVGVVSEPWFQYENGPLLMLLQDARAGFTGEGGNLIKAAAEGDILLKVGKVSIGPFHPVASVPDSGDMTVSASDVPVTGPGEDIRLDYVRVGAKLPVERGDLSLKGVLKASWMPVEMSLNVSLPSTLDGAYADIGLSRTKLDDMTFPTGWLPSYLEGLHVSGGVDADIFVSTGGITVGGYAASGRLSSDGAAFRLPVHGSQLFVSGARIRNARFSTLPNGFSCELPEGFKADKVDLGRLTLSDVQLWPCRFTFPGDGNIGSATAYFCGGRFIASAARGELTADGHFSLSSSFDLSASGVDLDKLAQALPCNIRMSGSADFSVRISPTEAGARKKLSVLGTVKSGDFLFAIPGAISIKGSSLDSEWVMREGVRMDLNKPALVNALSVCGVDFSGRAEVEGWIKMPCFDVLIPSPSWSMDDSSSDLTVRVSGGDAVHKDTGLIFSGLKGLLKIETGKNPVASCNESMKAASLSLGALKADKLVLSFSLGQNMVPHIGQIIGSFYGGKISISSSETGSTIVQIEGVQASELVQAIPSLAHFLNGTISGRITCDTNPGDLHFQFGSLHLDASDMPLDGASFSLAGGSIPDNASVSAVDLTVDDGRVLMKVSGKRGQEAFSSSSALPVDTVSAFLKNVLGEKLSDAVR